MKKLMIAAAIVCVAAISQAASVAWGFNSGAIAAPTAAYDDGDGFLINGLASLLISDGAGGWNTAFENATMNEDFTWGATNADAPADSSFVTGTSGQAFKLILTTMDGKYKIEYAGTSEEIEVVGMGTSTFIAGMLDNTAYEAGQWQSVPEPTSGLLLLLGVAGLALRRRRA